MLFRTIAEEVYKSEPKRGKQTEEEGDLLYEDDVNVDDVVYLRNTEGMHLSRGYGPLLCRLAE